MAAPDITGATKLRYDSGVAHLDQALLALLRARDPDTLRSIVNDHGRRLYRAARGMGHSLEESEDLVQGVFVTFLESLDRFEGRAQVGTWLFGILHHTSLERRRAMIREQLNDPIDQLFESQFDGRGSWTRPPIAPDEHASARESGTAIAECLGGLPEQQREGVSPPPG